MEIVTQEQANATLTDSQLKAQQLANASMEGRGRAAVFNILTRAEFKPELVNDITKTIVTLVRSAEGLTGKLFRLIQQCDTVHQAKGTFAQGESIACEQLKAKNLSQVATTGGIKALGSYMSIKSTLFGAIERSDDLGIVLQELWNFETKYESKEQRFVPEGFLDPWGLRYKEKDKGSTLFMSDYRMGAAAGKTLQSKQELHRKAQERALKEASERNAAAGAADTATNGANAGMAGGGRASQDVKIDEQTIEALNDLKRAIHDAIGVIEPSVVRQHLYICRANILTAVQRKHDDIRDKAAESGSRPIATEEEKQALPEVSSEGGLFKPDWVTEDDWNVSDSEEDRAWFLSHKDEYLAERGEAEEFAEEHNDTEETQAEPDAAVG